MSKRVDDRPPKGASDTERMRWNATSALHLATDSMKHLPDDQALEVVAEARAHFDAFEAGLLADQLSRGLSTRRVQQRLTRSGKTSKKKAAAATRRAGAVKENPDLLPKLKSGDLSTDQADVLAHASEKTGGAAARNTTLIKKLSGTTPEQGQKIAKKFITDHTEPDTIQSEYDKHRRIRNVRRSTSETGSHLLIFEGDEPSIDQIEATINTRSAELYQQDGGRDTPGSKHPRTRDQRNFDAAVDLLTREPSASTPTKPTKGNRPKPATVFITLTVDQATATDITPATQIGGGTLPASVTNQICCDAEFIGQVFSQQGELMWHGRAKRNATHAQWLGLVSRDQSCVKCGAHWSICHAHHIRPYEALVQGETNIDELVLVCPPCHTELHDLNLTIFRETNGTWNTRPATPDEIAPKYRPDQSPTNRAGPHRPQPPPKRRKPTLTETRNKTLF